LSAAGATNFVVGAVLDEVGWAIHNPTGRDSVDCAKMYCLAPWFSSSERKHIRLVFYGFMTAFWKMVLIANVLLHS